jgi:hypothetical protein
MQPQPEEGLRLLKAFRRIESAERRERIIEMAEREAGGDRSKTGFRASGGLTAANRPNQKQDTSPGRLRWRTFVGWRIIGPKRPVLAYLTGKPLKAATLTKKLIEFGFAHASVYNIGQRMHP